MTELDARSFFQNLPLFRNVPENLRSRLASGAKLVSYQKLEHVIQEGEPAEASWWVAEGIVKISKLAPDGRMSTMEMLLPGDVFAPAGVMPIQFYPANAIAVTPARAFKVPKSEMAAFAQAYPPIAQSVLQEVSQRLQRAHRLRVHESSSSEKKVTSALLWLFEKAGKSVGVSRREIAEIAGVAPETAIRILLDMKKKKWIQAQTRSVIASDPAALQDFLDGE